MKWYIFIPVVSDVCTYGSYGSTCTEKCHCIGNIACDKITGECPHQNCVPCYEVHMGQVYCKNMAWGCTGNCMNKYTSDGNST